MLWLLTDAMKREIERMIENHTAEVPSKTRPGRMPQWVIVQCNDNTPIAADASIREQLFSATIIQASAEQIYPTTDADRADLYGSPVLLTVLSGTSGTPNKPVFVVPSKGKPYAGILCGEVVLDRHLEDEDDEDSPTVAGRPRVIAVEISGGGGGLTISGLPQQAVRIDGSGSAIINSLAIIGDGGEIISPSEIRVYNPTVGSVDMIVQPGAATPARLSLFSAYTSISSGFTMGAGLYNGAGAAGMGIFGNGPFILGGGGYSDGTILITNPYAITRGTNDSPVVYLGVDTEISDVIANPDDYKVLGGIIVRTATSTIPLPPPPPPPPPPTDTVIDTLGGSDFTPSDSGNYDIIIIGAGGDGQDGGGGASGGRGGGGGAWCAGTRFLSDTETYSAFNAAGGSETAAVFGGGDIVVSIAAAAGKNGAGAGSGDGALVSDCSGYSVAFTGGNGAGPVGGSGGGGGASGSISSNGGNASGTSGGIVSGGSAGGDGGSGPTHSGDDGTMPGGGGGGGGTFQTGGDGGQSRIIVRGPL